MTDAAQAIAPRAHALCGRIAVEAPEHMSAATAFFDHVNAEQHRIGFTYYGITINSSSIAQYVYVLVGFVFTASSWGLQSVPAPAS